MRFNYNKKRKPYNMEERTIRKFAFLPVAIAGEIRWWEWVWIHQQYMFKISGKSKWYNVIFV